MDAGVKWVWRSNDYPPPSSIEVEERIELYLYPTAQHVRVDFKGRKTPRQEQQNHSLTRHNGYKLIHQNMYFVLKILHI
jgi:hypothetical protein